MDPYSIGPYRSSRDLDYGALCCSGLITDRDSNFRSPHQGTIGSTLDFGSGLRV